MKNKRFAGMLLIMLMMVGILAGTLTVASAETTVTVSSWSGMQNAINNAKKDTVIQLTKDITCTKNGGDRLKVDGKTITIDLNGHKINRNRDKSDSDGHVIELVGSAYVTLKDSKGGGTITGGYATRGGGINIGSGAWLVFQGGTITGNKAEWGGGIYVHGTLAMQGGTIKKNHATDSGGGIHVGSGGTIRACNSGTITENTADDCGGIYNSGSKTVWLRRLKITDNTSDKGGGGLNNNKGGTMSVYMCTISGNTAKDNGAGIYNASGCTLTIEGGTISENIAEDDGGAIYTKGSLTITNGTKITDNSANDCGGIFNSGATVELDGVTLKGNKSHKGGGGFNNNDSGTATLTNCTITENHADDNGGGIYNTSGSTLKLKEGTISNNTADDDGGAIYTNGTLNIEYTTITDNSANDCGGIFNSGASVDLYRATVTKNKSKKQGGGGLNNNDSGKMHVYRCTVSENEAEKSGGGIYNTSGSELTVNYGTLAKNRSNFDGGAIYTEGKLTVKNNPLFDDNYAFNSGGAIRVAGNTTTIESGTFKNNEATDHGGAIYVNDSTLKLYGGKITDNNAWKDGGGVLVGSDGNLKVHGAPVVRNNAAEERGDDIFLRGSKKIELDAALTSGAMLTADAEKVFDTIHGGDEVRKKVNDAKNDEIDYKFTKNFNKYNKDEDVAKYFATHARHTLLKSGDEAAVRPSNWSKLVALVSAAKNGDTVVLDRDYYSVKLDAALGIDKNKAVTIDLNGHTLDRGLTKPTPGGAVIMNSGTLTIKDSAGGGKITGGYADDRAGGIWNPGTLTLEGGEITGNHCVSHGGGIHNSGKLTITGGTISNNTAGGNGGGVYTDGNMTISGGEIKGNTADLSGGALNIAGMTTTITGGAFTGNRADRYHGGGIYLSNATLNLQAGEITGNTAMMEGGGLLYGANSTLNVQGAPVVNDNTAPTGANILIRKGRVIGVTGLLTEEAKLDILAQETKKVLTSGLESSGNDATAFTYAQGDAPSTLDGEIYVDLDVKADVWVSDWDGLQKALDNAKEGQIVALSKSVSGEGKSRIKVEKGRSVTIELNGYNMSRARTKEDGDGQTIVVKNNSTLTITDTVGTGTITGGWAKHGGGIVVEKGSTCILKGGTVRNNKATYGGGVYAHGTFKMEGGTISGNNASDSGGGIHVGSGGTLALTGGTIANNTSDDCGGVYNSGSKNVTLENVTITNNTSARCGGGFNNNDGGEATLKNCFIRGNTAAKDGGGLWNQDKSKLTLDGCTVEGNTAQGQGGGIFTKGTLSVTGGAIKDNIANGNSGGGIRVWNGEATINSGEITGNKVNNGQGGGVYVGGATLKLYGGNITGNTASKQGDGVFIEDNDSADVHVKGAPVVKDNEEGGNFYLSQKRRLTMDGPMTKGAEIYVSLQGLEYGGANLSIAPWDLVTGDSVDVDITRHDGYITSGFNNYNNGEDPIKYFKTDVETFTLKLRDSEVLVLESDWYDLQRQIDAAPDGATITLEKDWFGCDKDDALNNPRKKTLTIDLNGHTLNRGLYKPTAGGAVIMNYGTLTIKDSRGGGVITGGNSDDNAGGIWNDGALTIEGGTITGNQCVNRGGGIYNNSSFFKTDKAIIKGGTISNNTAGGYGGGVYTRGTLEISGGTITGNTAGLLGGGMIVDHGTTTITGGTITGNKATKHHGGGIFLTNSAKLNLFGGEITDNRATMEGGGILLEQNGTLNVEGDPVVDGNDAPTGANILLYPGKVITVTGLLTDGAKLDVTAQNTDDVLTSGLESSGSSLDRFTYANGSVKVSDKGGELYVSFDVKADYWADSWKGLQDAVNKARSGQTIALSNDISADGADRIKVEDGKSVTLDLNGYNMIRRREKKDGDGQVIVVKGNSTLTITDSRGTGTIKGGWAKHGGGIVVEKGSTCILKGGTITENKAEWGGGVYAHGTFKMEGGVISGNEASESGGGIHCGSGGTLSLTGGSIINNTSDDCGGVYNSGSKNVTLENVTIANNTSVNQSGGGFNNNHGGSATLTNCVIRGNTAAKDGGGLWNQDNASLTLTNCKVTGNRAEGQGGGVYAQGTLTLSGGNFKDNTAGNGGGLAVPTESKAANISGSLVVNDNTAPNGNNVFLASDKAFTVSGAMADGAKIGLFLDTDTGVFAKGFGTANPDTDPARYFFSENGWDLAVVFGDAALIDMDRLTDSSNDFIHGDSQIVSYENVNSRNWMSGISGERTLNEINLPGTHDAAMARPDSARSLWEDGASFFGSAKYAQTQIRYIDEQMNDGYRYFDLRLNNKYQKRHNVLEEINSIDYRDDKKNLWLCHGCDKIGGTYYALNHEGKPTSLDEVLEWSKNFLRKNPSEVIILSVRPETQWPDQWDTIYQRTKKIFYKFSCEINPSTNKPYLYMEDGVFGKDLSDYPKLKDCRGQVILRVNHDRDKNGKANLGGLASFNAGGKKSVKPEGGFEETPEIIIQHVNQFYNRYGGVRMPTDALTHLNLHYYVPTNIVEKLNVPILSNIPIITPVDSAKKVNPVLYGDGGTFDKPGYYLGWVCMIDRATSYEAARIWRTNFFPMDYVTVTVKSGLSTADLASGQYTESEGSTEALGGQDDTAAAEASGQATAGAQAEAGTKTYTLLKGTEITIPECIYEYDPQKTGRAFQSWNATGETVNETRYPGETFVVMEDTVFTGQWLADGETSVDVVWQDMDNQDGLRADSLDLEVWPDDDPEHAYTQTVTKADGWRAVLSGDVKKIVPAWELINANLEQGEDNAFGYRYEVGKVADMLEGVSVAAEGEKIDLEAIGTTENGLVVRLIHTPGGSVAAMGTVAWEDYDDRDGLRPESVTLRLMKGEEELDTATVTAENEWKFDFGELPVYEDGQAVAYQLTEDAIAGYRSAAVELTEAKELTVTNVHYPKVENILGVIEWNDGYDADGARPESTTVRLLANGEEVASLVVTKDGADTTLLEVPEDTGDTGASGEAQEEYEEETEEFEEATEEDLYMGEAQPEAESAEPAESAEVPENGSNYWVWSFYGVPVNSAGSEVTYTIVQDDVEGYSTEAKDESDSVRFINTPLPQSVTIAFDANGGEGEMESVEIDPRDEYALPDCGFTAPEGMEFAGWAVLMEAPQVEGTEGEAEATEPTEEPAEATVYNVGDIITFNANAAIIAQWQPIPPVYTIAFDGNGGEGEMEAAQPNEEGEYTLPENAFTAPEGMEFVGWKIAAEGATTEEAAEGEEIAIEDASEPSVDPERTYEPGDTITLTTDVTAIAQWQEPAKPIVITFDANGGEGEMEAAQPDEFGEYVLPENGFTAPEGAEFAGWLVATEAPEADGEAADEAGRVFSAGDAIVVSADTTVVAQWLSNEPEESEPAVVTFDANGGEGEMEPAQPDEEGNYELPECAFTAPEGMEFAGWMVGEMTYQAGGTIAVFESIEAVAQWQEIPEEISVTVTLKVVNGAWTDDTKDDKIIVLTGHEGDELRLNLDDLPGVGYNPDEGYAMGSWDVEPSINIDIEGIEPDAPIAEDTTYTYTYAVKEEVEVPTWTVLFDANGGEGEMASATVENMDGYALPECGYTAPEGMEFAGWLFDEYVLDPGEVLVVSSDIQVTAQWKAIEAAPVEGQPTEQQPTEEQPTEEKPTEEQPTEEQPTEEQPTEGQPTEGQPTEGQPTEEQPTEQQPTEEQATEEKPAEEKSSDEQPTEEQLTEGQPTEGQPTEGQPTEGQPTEDQPTEEQPTEEQPTEEQPTEEQPTEEKPAEEKSSDEQPTEGQPTEEQPTEQQPTEEQPTEQQPVDEQPTEQQPTEQQPTEEQPTEQQPVEQQPVEQQPVEEQPTEQQPVEQQPTEQQPTESEPEEEKAAEAPSAEEQQTEQQPTEEQPVEQQPVEQQPVEEQPTEQQPVEQQPTEQQPTESEPEEEKAVEAPSTEEQPTEQQPVEQQPVEEQPTEQQPVEEQPTEQQPVEQQPTEQQPTEGKPAEQKPAEAPADAQMCTITFDGGGADGEMAPVQVAKGSKYTLPECDFYIDGCTFSVWTVYADGVETAACFAGDAITVNGDITVMAGWTFDEGGEIEYGADNTEYVEGGTSDSAGNGLEVETEDSGLDVEYEEVETELSAEPSEVGSVFNGAGLAAIIAAVVLVLGGAAIAILKKKRK